MKTVDRNICGWFVAAALTLLLGTSFVPSGPGPWRSPPSFSPDRLRAIQRNTDVQGQIQRLRENRMQRDLHRQMQDLRLKQDALKFRDKQQLPQQSIPPVKGEGPKIGTVADEPQ